MNEPDDLVFTIDPETTPDIQVLDNFVDEYVQLRDADLEEMTPEEKSYRQDRLDRLTIRIIECLDRSFLRYGMVLSGRRVYNPRKDTGIRFLLRLFSVSDSLNPANVRKAGITLHRFARILRDDLCVEDSVTDSHVGYASVATDHIVRHMEIYNVFRAILIEEILAVYKPVYKAESHERVNFIRFFLLQFSFSMRRYISEKGGDVLNWYPRLLPTEDGEETHDQLLDYASTQASPAMAMQSRDDIDRTKPPWSLLTQRQIRLIWGQYVDHLPRTLLFEREGLDQKSGTDEMNRATLILSKYLGQEGVFIVESGLPAKKVIDRVTQSYTAPRKRRPR